VSRVVQDVAAPEMPGFACIAVPNSGSMSDQPTNAVIVGTHEVFIVDPGDKSGVEIITAALARRENLHVKAIVLTHAHPDHATAAPALKERFGCPILLNPKEQPILRQYLTWTSVDGALTGGMTLSVEGIHLEVIDTPGHSPGHVSLFDPVSRILIAGDIVSGMGTVGIFPPHGKMVEYLDSLARVQELAPHIVIPGHGPILTDPPALFLRYIERRRSREAEILAVVTRAPTTIAQIVGELYPDVLPHFRHAAAATTLAHLEKLRDEGQVVPESDDVMHAQWAVAGTA